MASPKIIIFFLFDETTGAPLVGATPTFDTYKDSDGLDISPPAVTNLGGGAYKFTPVFPTDKGLCFVVNGGAGSAPRRQSGFLRPEDYALDGVVDLVDEAFGKWEIKTSGADANNLILYRQDGVTILKKFALYNDVGTPTYQNPFKRIPV